jgi:hypothetical protein
MNKPNKEWEKRFTKQYKNSSLFECWDGCKDSLTKFIQTEIDNAKKEVVDEIQKTMRAYRVKYPDANWDDAIGIITGTKLKLK